MNESQRRAYAALALGPQWQGRAAAIPAGPGPLPIESPASVEAPAAAKIPGPQTLESGSTIALLDWQGLRERVRGCQDCGLCKGRTQTVFGVGSETAGWMLVGEAPGAEEDARGEPFVGQAGRLLDSMLSAIGLSRPDDVFIANVLKCRPPRNRDPLLEEVARCEPYLRRQIELVAPKIILVMGRFAAQSLLGTDASIASLRGRVHRSAAGGPQVPVVVTYHPAYLLRNLPDKAKAWSDLLFARRVLAEQGAAPQA